MEAFSLLKFWKATTACSASGAPPSLSPSTTIVTAHDSDESADDDGPFFDLEFAVPADDDEEKDEANQQENETVIDEQEEEDDEEVEVEPNLTFSPSLSDDLFFKGNILQIDGSEELHSGNHNKSAQFPIPVSLARSATKFRVFLLGLKRSNSKQCPPPQNQPHNNKFTVKFKVEEVPFLSLLTRASSNSKVNSTSSATTTTNDNGEKGESESAESGGGEAKRNSNKKEVVQRYLKMVKPLYVKVSKKNQKATGEEKREKIVGQKQQQQGLNLKVIAKKHLGKSKSGVVHSMVQNQQTSNINTTSPKKRDDSLIQQQDGIQSAILHCKRSFKSSTEEEEASSELLTQLVNESLNAKMKTVAVDAAEEGNGGVAT